MAAAFVLFGLLVGAFLNWCADEWAAGRKLRRRPSCPFCERARPASAWLSILAYLRGRPTCSGCGAPISWRHPLLEVAAAALFAVLAARYPEPPRALLYAVYSSFLLLLTVVDLERGLLPNAILLPAALTALVGSILHPVPGFWQSALLGAAAGLGLLLLAFLGGKLLSRRIWQRAPSGRAWQAERDAAGRHVIFGFGDVCFGGLIGGMLGVPSVFGALALAVGLGGVAAGFSLLHQTVIRRQYTPWSTIPYGPFLATGALAMLIFDPRMM